MKPNIENTANNASISTNADVLESLRAQLRSLEHGQKAIDRNADRISSGCDAFDQMLPAGGFLPGQLVEWLVGDSGHGGATLALTIARSAIQPRSGTPAKALVVIDRVHSDRVPANSGATFYPPAAAELGIGLNQLIVLRPNTIADEIWAIDQSLRCPSVGAVWAWLPKLNDRDFRRFQLSAEAGGTLGLLIRPARTRGEPTWADIQILVETRPSVEARPNTPCKDEPAHKLSSRREASPPSSAKSSRPPHSQTTHPRRRRWRITLLRCRGGTAGKQLLLELNETNGTLSEFKTIKQATPTGANRHEKSPLPLAAQLANPTSRRSPLPPGRIYPTQNRSSA